MMALARLFRPVSWGLGALLAVLAVAAAAGALTLWVRVVPFDTLAWLNWQAFRWTAFAGMVIAIAVAWHGSLEWIPKGKPWYWKAIGMAALVTAVVLWFGRCAIIAAERIGG